MRHRPDPDGRDPLTGDRVLVGRAGPGAGRVRRFICERFCGLVLADAWASGPSQRPPDDAGMASDLGSQRDREHREREPRT